MQKNVLVLDQSYQPVKIVTWMRAVSLVLSGKAEMIEDDDSPIPIKSVTDVFYLSRVIRVFKSIAHKKRNSVPFTRYNIFLRDNFTCQYCGKRKKTNELNWDHVIPRSKGGKTSWDNIATACYPCNQKKADKTLAEARMRLIKTPQKPKMAIAFTLRLRSNSEIPNSWKNYIDPASFVYWNLELESE